jgi:mannose/fructose-specific phosphotransferase system component IIA
MPADGSSSPPADLPLVGLDTTAKCGVVLIGHGNTASALLEAARAIVPTHGLADVVAVDAGVGQTPELRARVCAAISQVDEGRGVLLLADLMGSSPCMCGISESVGHGIAVVSGLNLAMLTKLAIADRRSSPRELAEACADSAQRSVAVKLSGSTTDATATNDAAFHCSQA